MHVTVSSCLAESGGSCVCLYVGPSTGNTCRSHPCAGVSALTVEYISCFMFV